MAKRDEKYAGWFADYSRRCSAMGYVVDDVMKYAGIHQVRACSYRRGVIPIASTRVKLENALLSYEPPEPIEQPEPKPPAQIREQREEPKLKPRARCNGDKIDCPYIRRVDSKLGYCPLPRCVMDWGK